MLAFAATITWAWPGHPALATAACEAAHAYGLGSGGFALVSGHSTANALLEHDLARFVGLLRALYFYAGYATNVGIVPALVGAGDALFSDALNHACLIDGARLVAGHHPPLPTCRPDRTGSRSWPAASRSASWR